LSILELLVSPEEQVDVLLVRTSLTKNFVLKRLTLKSTHVELPLLIGERIMLEVAFINADDDCILSNELCHQSANPESSLVVLSVSVLGIGFVQLLELETELLLHDLS
jgi:hypothetical protein